jgi:Uma2 family endonuclease
MTRTAKADIPRRGKSAHIDQMPYEGFLELDGDNQHVEWVNGEVITMPPVSNDHQDLGGFLYAILRPFVEASELGVVRHEPFQMKTGPELPGRSPDIIFIAKRNLARLKKNHLEGPADVAIEIISPGSRAVDRGDKHYEYERGGVREYWLLDPERKQAEFYVLSRDRIYRPADIIDGIFRSTVVRGFWLRIDWLFQRPLPSTLFVLRELKLP